MSDNFREIEDRWIRSGLRPVVASVTAHDDLQWLIAEVVRLRQIATAAEREELRHIQEVDARTEGMPEVTRAWYRQGHTAGCDLAGVLAFARHKPTRP